MQIDGGQWAHLYIILCIVTLASLFSWTGFNNPLQVHQDYIYQLAKYKEARCVT